LRYFTKKPGYAAVFLRFARPAKMPERRRDWLKISWHIHCYIDFASNMFASGMTSQVGDG
jgi:hypothetical protein